MPVDHPGRDHQMRGAGAAIPPQLLLALLRPALSRVGNVVLDARQQLHLQEMLEALSDILTEGLNEGPGERRVALEWLTGGIEQEPPEARFGLALATAVDTTAALITLDLSAARAIVDLIATQLADLRGSTEITQTDHGLLEFTVLSAIDELVLGADPSRVSFALSRFLGRAELIDPSTYDGLDPLWIRVVVGAREGLGAIWLPQDADLLRAAWTSLRLPRATHNVTDGEVEAVLALPPVVLDQELVRKIAPGDVVMIGATDLSSFGSHCRLVTTNAWQLSVASVVRDVPGLVSVRCGELRPEVYEPPAAAENTVALLPITGSIRLMLDQIQGWQAGAVLDLVTSSVAPVDLLIESRWFASGELVRVEGEIGVRVLEREVADGGVP